MRVVFHSLSKSQTPQIYSIFDTFHTINEKMRNIRKFKISDILDRKKNFRGERFFFKEKNPCNNGALCMTITALK